MDSIAEGKAHKVIGRFGGVGRNRLNYPHYEDLHCKMHRQLTAKNEYFRRKGDRTADIDRRHDTTYN